MTYCFQFCLNFAFKFNLRRYTLAVFGVALALASIPPMHRRVHGGALQL
jgi:hypothetical protein